MKKYYDFSKMTKQEIMDKVIEVWENGTSRDSRIVVDEAKRNGVSYEELCDYKRRKKETWNGVIYDRRNAL